MYENYSITRRANMFSNLQNRKKNNKKKQQITKIRKKHRNTKEEISSEKMKTFFSIEMKAPTLFNRKAKL